MSGDSLEERPFDRSEKFSGELGSMHDQADDPLVKPRRHGRRNDCMSRTNVAIAASRALPREPTIQPAHPLDALSTQRAAVRPYPVTQGPR